MVAVYRQEGETFESLLKRFRKKVQEAKILSTVRRHRFYEKPSEKRKRKAVRKRIKSIRTTRKMHRWTT